MGVGGEGRRRRQCEMDGSDVTVPPPLQGADAAKAEPSVCCCGAVRRGQEPATPSPATQVSQQTCLW